MFFVFSGALVLRAGGRTALEGREKMFQKMGFSPGATSAKAHFLNQLFTRP